jgi:hypothetical protein
LIERSIDCSLLRRSHNHKMLPVARDTQRSEAAGPMPSDSCKRTTTRASSRGCSAAR